MPSKDAELTVPHSVEKRKAVYVTESLDSGRLVQVMVRTHKVPEVGDKFASRHGQQGVIGGVVDPENLPFTTDGVVPDFNINQHAMPTIMTVANV